MINIFDAIVILFILMFGVIGFKNGLIKEGVSFIGIVAVFIISYAFKGVIGNVLCKILPFFTFSGKIKGLVVLNILIYQLVGFFLLFSILYGIYHIILFASKIIQKILDVTIILLLPSKIGGLIIGLIKGYILAFIVLLLLMLPLSTNQLFKDSKVSNFIINDTPILSHGTSDLAIAMVQLKSLVVEIEEEKVSVNDANLQLLETMIKFRAIDLHTLEQIRVLDKLNTVKGIDKVINNIDKEIL